MKYINDSIFYQVFQKLGEFFKFFVKCKCNIYLLHYDNCKQNKLSTAYLIKTNNAF